MNLYNVKYIPNPPGSYLITKFDEDLNIQSSYITTLTTCDCPAGQRPTCRHRQMLPQFIENRAVDANLFYDFDTKTFYDGPREEPLDDVVMDELNATLTTQTEVLAAMAAVVSETEFVGERGTMANQSPDVDPNLFASEASGLDIPQYENAGGVADELVQTVEPLPPFVDQTNAPAIPGVSIPPFRHMTPAEEAENAKEHKFEQQDQAQGLRRRI